MHYCKRSLEEYQQLCQKLVYNKTFIPLNSQLRFNSFLSRSDPQDVARLEERTLIGSAIKGEAGLTNHWYGLVEMRKILKGLFKDCMRGRTLYAVLFSVEEI